MKRRVALFSLCTILAATAFMGACSKKAADTSSEAPADMAKSDMALSTAGAGGLTPQQIADAVSKSVCKRMSTCNPKGGSEADCATGLSKDMASNLSDKAKAIDQTALDACIASITKATCEQLAAPTPPAGCEFMN
ncbi:MAG: hypothetical protein COV45_07805 [Deltaproteobacteria bacterium CG11_big_fil_rev_8_21_14_0_20_47_16]|nr:MAG: hypothetical protein COV45_07805 [Deltaproteobacteria bacterium CG11_big_fil_rev_8_21_14_0_20_47_16]